jgi:ribonucleoside-triphosphate reductase
MPTIESQSQKPLLDLLNYTSPLLPESFLRQYIGKQPLWGFGGLGYIVYKRTYARLLSDGIRTEEWWQTIARCINGAQKIGAHYTVHEAQTLFDKIFYLKCCLGGRMLWQLGTSTVERFGANSLLNCWFLTIKKPDDFCFLFENLMLGGGVGFSVKREDIHELPKIKKNVTVSHILRNDTDFIVPDSREGWVKLLNEVLNSYFKTGKSFTYSTIVVRGAGEKISGFGGTASGPVILIEGMNKICKILKAREGKKLRSIDALDICNIIGSIVVAGNVRRSAEIAIGDPDDHHFLRAKRWDLGNIPNWRAMSNNTVGADNYEQISPIVWEAFDTSGETMGFFNLPLSKKFGRLGELREDTCEGTNPCSEILLEDKECCNLSELFLNNITSKDELIECSTLLYKTQKAICAMNFIHEATNEVVHRNMRIGAGVTAVCQSSDKLDWLDESYTALREYDKHWSKFRGWPESIRLTTVKPSGTLSLLAGCTPGVHPGFSQYFIRRVRMSSNDSLVVTCRNLGYHTEYAKNFDGTENYDTIIVSFPCEFSESTLLTKDINAIGQLELVKKIQTIWSDNSVSVTVYYKKEELPEIKEWMKQNYADSLKCVSFLLHSDHGFIQAPYEEITKEKYKELKKKVKSLDHIIVEYSPEELEGLGCVGGVCPIK